ncbi:hypothetical protein [Acidisoma sp.]|uniref:hypothetical protein n=1 Tax=Acidisoma sp. TaxID=1872115 RepID=UPI003B00E7F6
MAFWLGRPVLGHVGRRSTGLGAWSIPVALGSLSLMAALVLSLQPRPSGPVALLFPPWWGAMRSIAAAARVGSIVRLGAVPFIVVVQPDKSFRRHVGGSLAWLVLDPQALGGCGLLKHISE